MGRDTLSQLATITAALFQREYSAIQEILRKESNLRQSLAQLDAQSDSVKAQHDQYCAMKAIGADFLWLAWVSKTRRELNIELAQVMAQKIDAMTKVQKAFGQKEAINGLVLSARQEQKKKAVHLQEERLSPFLWPNSTTRT